MFYFTENPIPLNPWLSLGVPFCCTLKPLRHGNHLRFDDVYVWFPSRALADILRQQGPVSGSQFEQENIAAIDGSPKDETPVRTSKNHYTPVHAKTSNHGRQICHAFIQINNIKCKKNVLFLLSKEVDMGLLKYTSFDLLDSFSAYIH